MLQSLPGNELIMTDDCITIVFREILPEMLVLIYGIGQVSMA